MKTDNEATAVNIVLKKEKSVGIVGFGEQRATCGDYTGRLICPACGNSRSITRKCWRWDCPRCYSAAITRAVETRIMPHLSVFNEGYGFSHWILSPDPKGMARLMLKQSVSAVYAEHMPMFRMSLGVMGICLYHPYRLSAAGKAAVNAWRSTHKFDETIDIPAPRLGKRLIPSYLEFRVDEIPNRPLPNARGDWKILHDIGLRPEYLEFSPHFHVLGCGYMPEWIQKSYRENGWVVRKIRNLKSPHDVSRMVVYLLSHAGYDGKGHVYRYLTPIGKKYGKQHTETVYDVVRCPDCGDIMKYARELIDDEQLVADLPQAVRARSIVQVDLVDSETLRERLYVQLRRYAYKLRDRMHPEYQQK